MVTGLFSTQETRGDFDLVLQELLEMFRELLELVGKYDELDRKRKAREIQARELMRED